MASKQTAASPVDRLLDRLSGVKQIKPDRWLARCPAHDDRAPSLVTTETSDGTLLIRCRAGYRDGGCTGWCIMIVVDREIPADQSPLGWGGKLGGARVWRSLAFAGICPQTIATLWFNFSRSGHQPACGNTWSPSPSWPARASPVTGLSKRAGPVSGLGQVAISGAVYALFESGVRPTPHCGVVAYSRPLRSQPETTTHETNPSYPSWRRSSAENCADHPGGRYPTSSTKNSKFSPGAVPRGAFASGANYHRGSCKRRRTAGARLAHDDISAHQGWDFPCSYPTPRCSRELLARVRCLWIPSGYNGWRPTVKRGKAPAGQKASRSLRRMKKKWRAKNHAS